MAAAFTFAYSWILPRQAGSFVLTFFMCCCSCRGWHLRSKDIERENAWHEHYKYGSNFKKVRGKSFERQLNWMPEDTHGSCAWLCTAGKISHTLIRCETPFSISFALYFDHNANRNFVILFRLILRLYCELKRHAEMIAWLTEKDAFTCFNVADEKIITGAHDLKF